MKSYGGIYNKIFSHSNLEAAICKAAKHKRNRPDTQWCIDHKEDVIEHLQAFALTEQWNFREHTPITIVDGSSKKERHIIKPDFQYEQILHHAIILQLQPIFMKGMYRYSCGSIPKRGGHYGQIHIQNFIKRHPAQCDYVLKMDIHHYFQSISHKKLIAMIQKTFARDKKLVNLLTKIIESSSDHPGYGIPIGYYTSQWLANWYLQGLDHYITEKLHAPCYVRYMDDMVIFSGSKYELHQIRKAISIYLHDVLDLELKDNWQVYPFNYVEEDGTDRNRCLDFMGFRFYRDRTTLRRGIMYKSTRKAARLAKKVRKGRKLTWYDAAQMVSYLSWYYYTDTYDIYLKWLKPNISVRQLEFKIGKRQRRINHGLIVENRGKSREAKRYRYIKQPDYSLPSQKHYHYDKLGRGDGISLRRSCYYAHGVPTVFC